MAQRERDTTNPPRPPITPRAYPLMEMAVERGVEHGWRRAHKHVDDPSEGMIIDEIQEAVMAEISEWFDFEDGERAATVGREQR